MNNYIIETLLQAKVAAYYILAYFGKSTKIIKKITKGHTTTRSLQGYRWYIGKPSILIYER